MRAMSCSVALSSTATMSVRGTITSRTDLSPASMMPWIMSRSCSSITPCSSDTWSSVMSSSSVRYGALAARPPVSARDRMVTAHSTGLKKVAMRSTGPAAASAALGVADRKRLGRDLGEQQQDHRQQQRHEQGQPQHVLLRHAPVVEEVVGQER